MVISVLMSLEPFDSQTHKVKLTPATINANARFFTSSKDVPTEAYTMGIGSILQAKHIILLAFGEQKQTQSTKWSTVKSRPLFRHQPSKSIQT